MTHMEFSKGIDRLRDCFGDKAYSNERIKLLFRLVGQESAVWWGKAVDQLIATNRQPPLASEIGELLSIERERRWSEEKKQNAKDAKQWIDLIPDEEKKLLFETIRMRVAGRIPDNDWENFLKLIRNLPEPKGAA